MRVRNFLDNMAKVIDQQTDDKIHHGRREKLRASFKRYGLETFNETQVLEYALGVAIPRIDTNPTAHRLMDAFGSLDGVISASAEKLVSIPGVGEQAASFLHFLKQFTIYMADVDRKDTIIKSSSDARAMLVDLMQKYGHECFVVLCLDRKGKVILHDKIHGDIDKVEIDVRKIADMAMRVNTASILFAHNHLTGTPNPSDADMDLTRLIVNVLTPLGIDVMDHIVFAEDKHYSFFGQGIIDIFKREHNAFVQSQDYKDVF